MLKGTFGKFFIPFINRSATFVLRNQVSHNYGGGHVDWTLSDSEAEGSFLVVTNADAGCKAILAKAVPGKLYILYNNSGQILTFKVANQTGGTIANGKHALYLCGLTDVVEVFEQA